MDRAIYINRKCAASLRTPTSTLQFLNCEAAVAHWRLDLRMVQKPGHELCEHIAVLQPFPVLGEKVKSQTGSSGDSPTNQRCIAGTAPYSFMASIQPTYRDAPEKRR
jgi:hypothetical protein